MRYQDEALEKLPKLEVLIGSVCFLMTRYSLNPTNELARAVSEHFELLYLHPDCHSPVLQDVGQRLAKQWEMLWSTRSAGSDIERPHLH